MKLFENLNITIEMKNRRQRQLCYIYRLNEDRFVKKNMMDTSDYSVYWHSELDKTNNEIIWRS